MAAGGQLSQEWEIEALGWFWGPEYLSRTPRGRHAPMSERSPVDPAPGSQPVLSVGGLERMTLCRARTRSRLEGDGAGVLDTLPPSQGGVRDPGTVNSAALMAALATTVGWASACTGRGWPWEWASKRLKVRPQWAGHQRLPPRACHQRWQRKAPALGPHGPKAQSESVRCFVTK